MNPGISKDRSQTAQFKQPAVFKSRGGGAAGGYWVPLFRLYTAQVQGLSVMSLSMSINGTLWRVWHANFTGRVLTKRQHPSGQAATHPHEH